MKQICIFFLYIFLSPFFSFSTNTDWGQTGHRAIAEIASNHLTEKAKVEINKLLKGKSLVVVSTYADEIRSEKSFDQYKAWHYVNIPFDKTYPEINPHKNGDLIRAIDSCIATLKDEKATVEDKVFYLKLLVHFIGDLHQPLHLGVEEDKGANDFQVRWFKEGTNLHAVWDSKMIDHYQMSYTELAENMPVMTKTEIEEIQKGSLLEWVEEIRVLTKKVYKSASKGEALGYRYMYDHFETVKKQLHTGGVRLAKILNDIFS